MSVIPSPGGSSDWSSHRGRFRRYLVLLFVSALLAVLLGLVARLVSLTTNDVLFIAGPILIVLLVVIGIPLVEAPDEMRPPPETRHAREDIIAQSEEGYGYGYGYPPS